MPAEWGREATQPHGQRGRRVRAELPGLHTAVRDILARRRIPRIRGSRPRVPGFSRHDRGADYRHARLEGKPAYAPRHATCRGASPSFLRATSSRRPPTSSRIPAAAGPVRSGRLWPGLWSVPDRLGAVSRSTGSSSRVWLSDVRRVGVLIPSISLGAEGFGSTPADVAATCCSVLFPGCTWRCTVRAIMTVVEANSTMRLPGANRFRGDRLSLGWYDEGTSTSKRGP